MNTEVQDLWQRAKRALQTAKSLVEDDPDASVSRAYYSAFYAVSAYFASHGQFFTKHTGVQAAVHRELVKTGKIGSDLGKAYSLLFNLRSVGDYGSPHHVTTEEAEEAVQIAEQFLSAIHRIDAA